MNTTHLLKIFRKRGLCAALLGMALTSIGSAQAQMRPLDPIMWELFDGKTRGSSAGGVNFLWGQRASLAGTEGRLLEVGTLQAAVRTGRVVLEAGGTVHRFFREESTFAPPAEEDLESAPDGTRSDNGDYRIGTIVRLTPPHRAAVGVLRFGTRLPTTNNRTGLERDQTDFYAQLGGRFDHGPVRATAELGIGLHGTRSHRYEQSDALVYALSIGLPRSLFQPTLILVGHEDGLVGYTFRGNEELTELRLQLRTGSRYWVQLQGIRGLTAFSPRTGMAVAAGVTF